MLATVKHPGPAYWPSLAFKCCWLCRKSLLLASHLRTTFSSTLATHLCCHINTMKYSSNFHPQTSLTNDCLVPMGVELADFTGDCFLWLLLVPQMKWKKLYLYRFLSRIKYKVSFFVHVKKSLPLLFLKLDLRNKSFIYFEF